MVVPYIYINVPFMLGSLRLAPINIYYAWITVTSFAIIVVYTHTCTVVFKKLNYGKKRK